MIIQTPGINGLQKTNGCEKAPDVIAESLSLKTKKIHLNNQDIDEQEQRIYNKAKKYIGKKPIFIGGDHSISYPLAKAFFESTKNPALLVFDAHPDLMEPMKNPTHEEWLRAIVEKGFNKILLVGIRKNSKNIDKKEIEFANKNNIEIIYSDEFNKQKIINFCKNKNIYLSLDIDVFDSTIVKSTGYPESNGLTEKNILEVLENLKNQICVADIVEYNPSIEGENEIILIKKILQILK